ncbi:MAG TPA: glutathione S-transferase family protein [Tabrizicola sp.]|nr:glutathione S-transferase family protein [Tabrizicola sp.]
MIRWISWGKENFVRACDIVSFETGTKLRYHIGPRGPEAIAEGHRQFHESAPILELHLARRDWLTSGTPSYADFRMATFLPWNANMQLPLEDYPALAAWYARLEALSAWADPFEGLNAPDLPPLP